MADESKERSVTEGFGIKGPELNRYIKYEYPFLLIDRVTEVVPGKRAKGYKNFTNNEWFFPAHYPDEPIVPGALQFEAIGQMISVTMNTLPGMARAVPKLVSFEVKCRKAVFPGDTFNIEANILSWRRGICKGRGVACVDGEIACEASIVLVYPSIMGQYMPKDT